MTKKEKHETKDEVIRINGDVMAIIREKGRFGESYSDVILRLMKEGIGENENGRTKGKDSKKNTG